MSCDRNICATNEYNGIGCDECCVSYDTAVQREQDAYDSGFGKAIEDVLEIIDKEYRFFSGKHDGNPTVLAVLDLVKRRIKALAEGDTE